jgi:hypothetical protein
MDKYYTPDISEFYVGFEYESYTIVDITKKNIDGGFDREFVLCKYSGDKFESDGINTSFKLKLHPISGSAYIRVKYLDKEDIESLGFEDQNDRGMGENYGYLFTKDSAHFESSKVQLRYWPTSNRVYVYDGQIIFNGSIKNKSELIKLLKQLGINGNN